MLNDVVATLGVVVGGGAALSVIARRTDPALRWLLGMGFVAHVLGVFAQVYVVENVYGGGSDIEGYYRSGVELANALRGDFELVAPEVVRLFFHDESTNLPFSVFGGVGPTGSMTVLASLLFLVFADSLYAASMAVALAAFFGKVAIFYLLAAGLPKATHGRLLIASVLVPSVVFWSSTVAKEAAVIAFLGLALILARDLIEGELRPLKLAGSLLCLVPIAMIKPYVLLPLAVAFSVWFYWRRAHRAGQEVIVRPFAAVVALVAMTAGLVVVGRIAPRVALENLAKSTATLQNAGQGVEGGSNYQLREAVPEEELSLQSQLALAPLALPTAWYRPFAFEVKNPMMLLNALETTLLLFLTIRLFFRGGFLRVRRAISSNSTLVFCLLFAAIMGTAVGLASTNLGSLSRYRMPFMPFFVALVLVLDAAFQTQEAGIRLRVSDGAKALEGVRSVR